MKIIIFTCCVFTLFASYDAMAQQGVCIGGGLPDPSAMLDVKATSQGILFPRLSTAQRGTITTPATGLVIYNTDCNTLNIYNGTAWLPLNFTGTLGTPGSITGNTTPCANGTGVKYSVAPVMNATNYTWTVPAGASITAGQGSDSITVTFGTNSGSVCVAANNVCETSNASCISVSLQTAPAAPAIAAGTGVQQTLFTANWGSVSGDTAYYLDVATDTGFNSPVSGYSNLDVSNVTTYNVTGLTCNTVYYYRVRAGNACGTSANSGTSSVTTSSCCSDAWTQKADVGGSSRSLASGFAIGANAFIGMGTNPLSQDFWEWNQANNTWTQKADYGGGARRNMISFVIGGIAYVGTGWDGSSYHTDFWAYDTLSNQWTSIAAFPGAGREGGAGFSVGSKGYAGFGAGCCASFTDFWVYDPSNNSWAATTTFPGSGRSDAVGFSIGGKGYIGVGFDGGSTYYNDFWEFDPSGTWTQKAVYGGVARAFAIGFSIGTNGYIGVGSNGSALQDIWEWSQTNNQWTQKNNFSGGPRAQSVGFSNGSNGFVGVGNDGSNGKSFWEYCP